MIEDAVRGIDLQGSLARAWERMREAGDRAASRGRPRADLSEAARSAGPGRRRGRPAAARDLARAGWTRHRARSAPAHGRAHPHAARSRWPVPVELGAEFVHGEAADVRAAADAAGPARGGASRRTRRCPTAAGWRVHARLLRSDRVARCGRRPRCGATSPSPSTCAPAPDPAAPGDAPALRRRLHGGSPRARQRPLARGRGRSRGRVLSPPASRGGRLRRARSRARRRSRPASASGCG